MSHSHIMSTVRTISTTTFFINSGVT